MSGKVPNHQAGTVFRALSSVARGDGTSGSLSRVAPPKRQMFSRAFSHARTSSRESRLYASAVANLVPPGRAGDFCESGGQGEAVSRRRERKL